MLLLPSELMECFISSHLGLTSCFGFGFRFRWKYGEKGRSDISSYVSQLAEACSGQQRTYEVQPGTHMFFIGISDSQFGELNGCYCVR